MQTENVNTIQVELICCYHMDNKDTILYQIHPNICEHSIRCPEEDAVLQGFTALKIFYSLDLGNDRMRCHHPEQGASRQHIPRKLYSHVM